MQETDFVMYNMIRFLRDWMFMDSDEKKSDLYDTEQWLLMQKKLKSH